MIPDIRISKAIRLTKTTAAHSYHRLRGLMFSGSCCCEKYWNTGNQVMAIPVYLILQIYAPSLKYSLSRMVEIGSHLTKSIVDVKLDNPTSADSNLFVLIYVSFIY